jgi:hypothetical protein
LKLGWWLVKFPVAATTVSPFLLLDPDNQVQEDKNPVEANFNSPFYPKISNKVPTRGIPTERSGWRRGVGKSPLNYRRGMPLASLIKLCGTRRRESELINNEQIIDNNYKWLMINYKLNDTEF